MTAELLTPPENGVTVRMYRPGHGDCFLLAFPRDKGDAPYFVLIDCGYKPGSQKQPISEIIDHLRESCDGHIDLAILTHEHQDHLNGIWKAKDPPFAKFEIDRAWVAWTENKDNALANELRTRHKDQLLGLLVARDRLADRVRVDDPALSRLESLLDLELGDDGDGRVRTSAFATAEALERSANKQGLRLVQDMAIARKGRSFRSPGDGPLMLDGSAGVRAYVLGPPQSTELISDEDPRDGEGFPLDHPCSFASAFREDARDHTAPFGRPFRTRLSEASSSEGALFFKHYYGTREQDYNRDEAEVPSDAKWRRIDDEWLYSAETLALKLNRGINNTSLVVAFELPRSRKVMLFVADAQRGNWISWADVKFNDAGTTVTAKDLLARTVLYKAGHHGSHNATLSGTEHDTYPNLSWMGRGAAASEFTAMITAVEEWALTKNRPPWVHPLPSIRDALVRKARGRVFQTDRDLPEKPDDVSDAEWEQFLKHAAFNPLYFDWSIIDE